MAEQKTSTRKTPTRKTTTKVETKTTDVEKVENKVEKSKEKVKLSKDDKIPVMNNTTGRYGYIGRSGYSFELEEYGDVTDVPFGELQAMRSGSQKRHLEDAFIIILDEEAVEELNYTKLYENVLDSDGVEELLSDVEKLNKVADKMPLAMRETVISVGKRKYKDGTLSNLHVIRAIENNFNVKILD
ncbi:hypothetical protein [Bacillus sp. FJAT-22090]|uniref:hypothetical protein n=1 Tax=Bacillus sp. FJAT-22090 TaxID=1581038 RepID=UPI0011A18961|nr:hypothetical protein [Bacillus sp. FJAT-22090]